MYSFMLWRDNWEIENIFPVFVIVVVSWLDVDTATECVYRYECTEMNKND